LENIKSIKQVEGLNESKFFVEQDNPHTAKRKKITVIRKKKHRDGSVDTTKQEIFKNFGD